MEKPILQMVGGEKHISPHYAIKSENTSCDISSKGFTGIEINGVRFSNIDEMRRYMDKQRTQLIEAKEIIKDFILMAKVEHLKDRYETVDEAEKFISDE